MANQSITLLLIEDNPGDTRLIREALSEARGTTFELVCADRLSSGLGYLARGGIDLVLLDLSLPDSQGLNTFARVHTEAPTVPIVVLSGLQDEGLAMEAVQKGAQDYLSKSFVMVESHFLVRSIRYAIERKRLERLKDEFLDTVSHELRTPLATIKEFTEILSDKIPGPVTTQQQEHLAVIEANIDRLARMINDLLDMAKVQSGHVLLNREFVETGPLLDHIIQSMRPLAEGKQITLEVSVPKAPPGIFADADKVTQALINLVSNAIKCTPESGRVTIGVEELPNEVQFRVEDTGIGIDPEDLPKLFEKFYQLSRPMSGGGSAKGTGLGLAICKRLVELHGGRIWAESRSGAGSTFSFTLPKYHVEEVLKEHLKTSITQARQAQRHFSIIVFAIAQFNQLQARYSPEAITQLLKEVEQIVRDAVRRRAGDVVVRWQRGEMIVILAEVDKAGCLAIAQRVTRTIEDRTYRLGQTEEHVTVITGSATCPDEAKDEEELLRMAEERIQHVSRPKLRILAVDDEPKLRQFLKEMLERRDFEVLTAASGPEALDRLKNQAVDLILLDLLMPVMDGYEVYHLLKENPRTKEIPVLIVTAKGERTDRRLGMETPSYHYVTKPFQVEELLAKIRETLVHQRSQIS